MTKFDIKIIKRLNLKRIIDEMGLTPTTFAKKVGMQQPAISRYLSEKENAPGLGDNVIDKICKKTGIDRREFFKGIEEMCIDKEQKNKQRVDIYSLAEMIRDQAKLIEEQGRRIDRQDLLIASQKDLIAAQGDRITEQGKRIDLISGITIETHKSSDSKSISNENNKDVTADKGDVEAQGI